MIAIRPLPSTLVNASLNVAFASNLGASTKKRLDRTSELIECNWTLDVRMPGYDCKRENGVQVRRCAAAGNELLADDCGMADEATAELAVALHCNAERPEGRCQRDAAVRDVNHEIRKRKRLVARRRQQLVDLSPADPPMHKASTQPHTASDNAVDVEIAVPVQAGLDMRVAGDEVRDAWDRR